MQTGWTSSTVPTPRLTRMVTVRAVLRSTSQERIHRMPLTYLKVTIGLIWEAPESRLASTLSRDGLIVIEFKNDLADPAWQVFATIPRPGYRHGYYQTRSDESIETILSPEDSGAVGRSRHPLVNSLPLARTPPDQPSQRR
jgi:hypothetical protein